MKLEFGLTLIAVLPGQRNNWMLKYLYFNDKRIDDLCHYRYSRRVGTDADTRRKTR